MLTSALRQLVPLGRTAGAELSRLSLASTEARAFAAAAAPKQSLDQFVENIRKEIADAYEDLVTKHEAYKQKFSVLVATSGVPNTSDFSAVVDWTNKTQAILKEVSYPERVWKLSADKVAAIQAQLKSIPAEKAEFAAGKADGPAPWYLKLTDAQVAEMSKNPRIFRELEKLHSYEEKLRSKIEKDAKDRGVPALALTDLPAKVDLESEHTFSAPEAKWCVDKANAKAADMIKNDPMIKDPYSSAQFKDLLKKNAEKYGIPAAQAETVWQKEGKMLGYI